MDDRGDRRVGIAIVGAPKCATTSMLRYLGQHPMLLDHPQKECGFFMSDDEWERGWESAHGRYFPKDPGPPLQLVLKRALMLYDRTSLERLSEHSPGVVVTALLRDPVDRAHSAYRYARLRGWQGSESFEDAIEPELADGPTKEADRHGPGGYLSSGVYVWHVRTLMELFPSEQVQLLTTEEVAEGGGDGRVWRALFEAAGVDPEFVPADDIRHNVGAAPRSERLAQALASKEGVMGTFRRLAPDWVLDRARGLTSTVIDRPAEPEEMAAETRATLRAFFEPYNRELEELIGRPLSWSRGNR